MDLAGTKVQVDVVVREDARIALRDAAHLECRDRDRHLRSYGSGFLRLGVPMAWARLPTPARARPGGRAGGPAEADPLGGGTLGCRDGLRLFPRHRPGRVPRAPPHSRAGTG